jgi:hypothetical protein
MSSRVELLPQSIAATVSLTDVDDPQFRHVNLFGHHSADGIEVTGEIVGEMGVQALNPDAGAADSPLGRHGVGSHGGRLAALCVLIVRSSKILGVDEFLEAMHAALTFQATHTRV